MKKVIKNVAKNTGGVCLIIIGLYVDFYPWPRATYNLGRIIYHKFSGKALSCCKVEEDKILQSICNQY